MRRKLVTVLVMYSPLTMHLLLAAEPSGAASTAPPRQVLIEAVILEVALNGSKALDFNPPGPPKAGDDASGVGALNNAHPVFTNRFVAGMTTNAAMAPLGGFSYAAKLTNDLDSMVTALCQGRRVKILQRPRIQTSHAVPATLFVGESRPVSGQFGPTRQTNGSPSAGQILTGVTLEVTPSVQADGLVVMDLRLRLDRFEGNVMIENVGEVPVTSSREGRAKVEVRDRDTVLLGGLTVTNKKPPIPYVRFPKDLPVPGVLLSLSSAGSVHSELLLLVRPTLLPRDGAAVPPTGPEKRKVGG